MSEVTTIGLDLAKNVFQVHGVDAESAVVIQRQLRRSQVLPFFKRLGPCLVGIEACATAHHWARQLMGLGHEVKVAVKSTAQQGILMVHRTRELLVRQRTMAVNAMRAHMAEFGIVAPVGVPQVKKLLAIIADGDDDRLPPVARGCLESLARQFLSLDAEINAAEKRIHAWHRSNETSRRLEAIPGIGRITASALAASVSDPAVFRSGRELAAWIGLVPRQNSTGGKQRLGRISKQGDPYLRWLLVAGALSVIRHAKRRGTTSPWLAGIIARKPTKVAAVALANKNARRVWAVLMNGEGYRPAAA
jgi:transposase